MKKQKVKAKRKYTRTQVFAVTVWDRPDHGVDSQYGAITYHQWCEKERERMGPTHRLGIKGFYIATGTGQHKGRICLAKH